MLQTLDFPRMFCYYLKYKRTFCSRGIAWCLQHEGDFFYFAMYVYHYTNKPVNYKKNRKIYS